MKSVLALLGPGLAIILISALPAFSQERSIRFHGTGHLVPGTDRIKIPLAGNPANVSGDFTIEFWIHCDDGDNNGNVSATSHGDGWIPGNVLIDRDIFGNADPGDFGLSIGASAQLPPSHRVVAFGLNRKHEGITIRRTTNIADRQWHHIAVTRSGSTGLIRLFVDGQVDAEGIGPAGDVAYPADRVTMYPASDPYLVIGAEKHDGGAAYPSFNGSMDELRISGIVRYDSAFRVPANAFQPDEATALLYHFDENGGTSITDAAGRVNGALFSAYGQAGPLRDDHSPFLSNDPAIIRSLRAEKVSRGVKLTWKIENASSSYEVQRSADGRKFIALEQVYRHLCASCEHQYVDPQPEEGRNIYRIKYISFGKEKYSPLTYAVISSTALTPSRVNP